MASDILERSNAKRAFTTSIFSISNGTLVSLGREKVLQLNEIQLFIKEHPFFG